MNARILLAVAACFGATFFLGCGTGNPDPVPAEEIEIEVDGPPGPMRYYKLAAEYDPTAPLFVEPRLAPFGGHYLTDPGSAADVHDTFVKEFIRQPGEGLRRFGPTPPAPTHWIELIPESEADRFPEPEPRPDDGMGRASFPPEYDEVGETLTFQDGSVRRVRDRIWQLRDKNLVSVDAKTGPAVYRQTPPTQTELVEGMKTGATAPKRPLDAFETAALARLRDGDDVAVQSSDMTLRVLGAVRAGSRCLECHRVEAGAMLGAFSYTLKLQSEVTPAADRLRDRAGLSDAQIGAVSAIEAKGGKVIRAPGGPVTELHLGFARRVAPGEEHSTSGHTKIRDSLLWVTGAFPELTALDVSHSSVSDAGLKSIAELKKLKKLTIRDTSATEAGIAEFRKARPDCEVDDGTREERGE